MSLMGGFHRHVHRAARLIDNLKNESPQMHEACHFMITLLSRRDIQFMSKEDLKKVTLEKNPHMKDICLDKALSILENSLIIEDYVMSDGGTSYQIVD